MNKRLPTITTINLGYEQMLVIDAGTGERVRVLHGATWLTDEGEAADVVLGAGQERPLRRGRTLIEGLEPASVERLTPAAAGAGAAWLTAWQRIGRGWRRLRARAQFGADTASASQACGA